MASEPKLTEYKDSIAYHQSFNIYLNHGTDWITNPIDLFVYSEVLLLIGNQKWHGIMFFLLHGPIGIIGVTI